MIKIGDKIPSSAITLVDENGQQQVTTDQFFAGKRVVMFAVPGAFTPTCNDDHLPGYVVNADKILEKGVDLIACLAVNDGFVLQAWRNTQNAEALTMLADGGAGLTQAMGLQMDTGDFGGIRSKRYALVVDDGIVTHMLVEQDPKSTARSSAEEVLSIL